MVASVHPGTRILAWIWTRLVTDRVQRRVMWWLNAKFAVAVTAIVRNRRGEVLLVRRRLPTGPVWTLPGAWIGRREDLGGAVRRQLRATGLAVEVVGPLTAEIFDLPAVDIAVLCHPSEEGPVGASVGSQRADQRWCQPSAPPASVEPYSRHLLAQLAPIAPAVSDRV